MSRADREVEEGMDTAYHLPHLGSGPLYFSPLHVVGFHNPR